MGASDITALLITTFLGLFLLILAIVLLCGKGAMMIAGFNTMPKKEREKYDSVALCRFLGGILLPIALTVPAFFLGGYFKIDWLNYVVVGIDVGLILFAIIYANTKNRFRKKDIPSASDRNDDQPTDSNSD